MRARPAGLLAAILLAIAFVALSPLPGRSADGAGFTIAVLRRDGILIPFATFDGNRWTNRWPVQHASDIPIGLADVPRDWWPNRTVTIEWKAWLVSGGVQPITVQAPVLVKVHCMRRVGLRSDYVSLDPAPPPDFQPYPKSGLAIAGDVTVEHVELLKPGTPEAVTVVDGVKGGVAEAETKSVRNWSRVWNHPLDEKGRAKTPLALEVLAKTPGLDPGSSVYYFEGVKKYPGFMQYTVQELISQGASALDKTMCDYLTFAGGWLLTGPKVGNTKASVGAALSNCNREGLAYMLPLGAIRMAGRLFWIVQTSAWDVERYEIIEIKAKETKVVLSVGGGACR